MKLLKNLPEKLKELQKNVIDKFTLGGQDARFISLGVFLPITFSSYRYYLKDDLTVFSPLFGQLWLERGLENVTILLFLPYLLFFFDCRKKTDIL